MKKALFSTLLIIAMYWQLNAQDQNGYIGISLGPSFPLGGFGKQDPNDKEAGWAKTGAIFDISLAYKLSNSNLGIALFLRGQANPLDVEALADEVASQLPGVLITVTATNWQIGGLLLGGYGSFPISEKASFDTKALIGFTSTTAPEITTTATSTYGSEWVKQSSKTASSFGYLLGAGFKFDIGKKLSFLTQVDYMGTKPEFKDVETTSSMGDYDKNDYTQRIQTLNLSVGLALKI